MDCIFTVVKENNMKKIVRMTEVVGQPLQWGGKRGLETMNDDLKKNKQEKEESTRRRERENT